MAECHAEKASAHLKSDRIDAVTDARRDVPLHAGSGMAKHPGRCEHRFGRDHLIGIAMNQQDRRRIGRQRLHLRAARQHAGITDDRSRLHRASQTDMQRHHRTLAEANERQAIGGKFKAREFGIEKVVERGRRGFDSLLHLTGIEPGDCEPLKARRRTSAALRRIRRHESDGRQLALPMRRETDQVVAVGAIAVTEHDEMRRLSALRRQAGTGECTLTQCHVRF